VLGCTHYPLIQNEILATLGRLKNLQVDGIKPYDSLIVEPLQIVDPAQLVAKELFRSLARARLRAPERPPLPLDSRLQYFISVPNTTSPSVKLTPDGSLLPEYKLARKPRQLEMEDTRVVPMRVDRLPPSSLNLIRTRLPQVWSSVGREVAGD
jgi:hypothetical protein